MHLLEKLLYPESLVFLLLLAALVFMKFRRIRTLLLIFAFIVLVVAGNGWFSGWLVKTLEWQYLSKEQLPRADAIVALSGGLLPKYYPRKTVEIGNQADRLIYAGWLYKQGKAPLIICTGGKTPQSTREEPYSKDMLTLLEMIGIPREAVVLESQSGNTYEHMRFCGEIFQKRKIRKILLVTSALHMPRAMAVFKQSNVEVIPAPTDFTIIRKKEKKPAIIRAILRIFPTAVGLAATKAAIHEYLGLFYYRFQGWI